MCRIYEKHKDYLLTLAKETASPFKYESDEVTLDKEVKPKKIKKLKKELPAHKVTISKDYYLATTEVTQGMWLEVIELC